MTLENNSIDKKLQAVTNSDGSVYTGPMKNGWIHGQGTLTIKGKQQNGIFKNGRFTGN